MIDAPEVRQCPLEGGGDGRSIGEVAGNRQYPLVRFVRREIGGRPIPEVAPWETGFRVVVANLESNRESSQGRKADQRHGRARDNEGQNHQDSEASFKRD